MNIDFYFDYLSPWAYFAHKKMPELKKVSDVTINYIPVPYPYLSKAWQQRAIATLPSKRLFIFKFAYRFAKKHNIPFNIPSTHPYKPHLSLRLSLPTVAGSAQHAVIDHLFSACWIDQVAMDSASELEYYLTKQGLDAHTMIDKTATAEVKQALIDNTEQAVKLGIWGVPTFYIDGEIFWGVDQFEYMIDYIQGKDPVAKLARPEAVLSQSSWGLNNQ